MQRPFKITRALFQNQDTDTLNIMVGDALEVDSANSEYCKVETKPTDAGVIVRVKVLSEETDLVKTKDTFILVPIDGGIIYQLGEALKGAGDESQQRQRFGDKTVDWLNTIFDF